ncbi:MAG: asparagine synthase-related protein, partial [SAR324 cluster bacterium]|nr:asparagine synthase-related protein [SAR324 cluster bacterium]
LRQMSGMFAFALLDRKENALYLARDRMGEKPLYFGKYGENIFFSSELKPILKSGSQQFIVEQASLAEHLVQGFIQAPKSILQNVSKVVPGTVLKFNLADLHAGPETETYWSICELASRENDALRQNSQQECTDLVHDELRRAVAGQLLSDVGLGTFLSGGIDSSLISALAAETSDRKLDSFTIGFEERSLDESKYASTVSAHLGLNHNELMMADSDLLAVVPELAEIYDEPFGDSSQIPTVALSKFARSKVTVALSGDGADELFGGYNRHTVGANLWKRARSLHKLGRWPMRSFFNILSEADFRRVYQLSAGLGFERRLPPDINQKIRKQAN